MDVHARNNAKILGNESGPTVVLAHGFGCDQNLWRLVTERLVTRFRVVLFDHVGAGASDPAAWDAQRYGAYVRDQIPGSALVTLDATGHCPHLSAPQATADAIAAFAGQV